MSHRLALKLPIITSLLTSLTYRLGSTFNYCSIATEKSLTTHLLNQCPVSGHHNIYHHCQFLSTMPPSRDSSPKSRESSPNLIMVKINQLIEEHKVMIFSKSTCPWCKKVKAFFDSLNVPWHAVELDKLSDGSQWQDTLQKKIKKRTVPQVFINGSYVGGHDDTMNSAASGKLSLLLAPRANDYDLVVIGGGSGGIACAKEAGRLGRKVVLINYVVPSIHGTKWGIGGTCVNVGCIPKKLMHTAALIGQNIKDSYSFGWKTADNDEIAKHVSLDWKQLVDNIQSHIKSQNFGYKSALCKKSVEYINAYATFEEPHKLKLTDYDKKDVKYVTGDRFLIATGTRPKYPNIPGAEYGITSDDLFSLPYAPGKTLIIGASYVALECASFLAAYGIDTSLMVRSILLRGFDQECANRVGEIMEEEGVKFIRSCVPVSIEQVKPGKPGILRVTGKFNDDKSFIDEFNTVIFAIGRTTRLNDMGLDKIGVKLSKNKKIPTKHEQTNIPHIYAVGDVMDNDAELAPLAIEAGFLLARRLFGCSTVQTDYEFIPTTVFTSLEYGSVGSTEEAAKEKYGVQNLEIFVQNFTPLEWALPHRPENKCFAKIICLVKENMRVIGLHYVGPNAGEVTQFAALCLKKGCTKDEFDALIGIHPTCAEAFTTLSITKRSGQSADSQGC